MAGALGVVGPLVVGAAVVCVCCFDFEDMGASPSHKEDACGTYIVIARWKYHWYFYKFGVSVGPKCPYLCFKLMGLKLEDVAKKVGRLLWR